MRKLINTLVMMMISAKQMRKLINNLVMMMIFAKTNEKTDKHSACDDICKTNEPNDKHSSDDDGSREEGKGIDCRSIDMQLNIQSLYE